MQDAAQPGHERGTVVDEPWSIDVLTLRGEHIAEITSFVGRAHFAHSGLPGSRPDHAVAFRDTGGVSQVRSCSSLRRRNEEQEP